MNTIYCYKGSNCRIKHNFIFCLADSQYNVTVKNAWKLHEVVRDKWYLLYTKTDTEKQKWLKAFNSERQKVKEDQENSMSI